MQGRFLTGSTGSLVGNHSWADSYPTDGDGPVTSGTVASAPDAFHSKASSLDSSVPTAPAPQRDCSSLGPVMNEARPVICERQRVVVSYPLRVRQRLNSKMLCFFIKTRVWWFKGTLQRIGKTGLFLGSFVENI